MRYNPIDEERKWQEKGEGKKSKPLTARHRFAHDWIHSQLCDTLVDLGCNDSCSILDVGCGPGGYTKYIQETTQNILGVDVSHVALNSFRDKGFQGVLADAKKLPFHSRSFDYILCSGLLHHLVGQGDLTGYLTEFLRVTREDGYVIAMEPNIFNMSGILVNIFNRIKPGITGLVPHERALSPFHLTRIFREAGLEDVEFVSASYVWNRFPLAISKFISSHDDKIRFKKPFSLFGWFVIIHGQKGKVKA